MDILFISDSYLPHAGGSRVYYHHLYKHLGERFGQRVTVLTKEVPGWREFDTAEHTPSFRIIRRFQPLRSWKFQQVHQLLLPLLHTIWLRLRLQANLLHVGDLYPQGVIALFCKKLFGLPYVVYCHGEEITQMDGRRLERRMRDSVYHNAARVIAASNFARAQLMRIGIPENRIEKINPAVDTSAYTPGPPPESILDRYSLRGKRTLLTVARLVPRKGHAAVIRALAQIIHQVPDAHYLIVGTGPEEGRLRDLARQLGIEHAITLAGYVHAQDLPDVYRSCELFLMPNFDEPGTGDAEGFGMVFLEANACGKPVIAGRSGGTAESVAEGVSGYRIDPADIDNLAATMLTVLQNDALRASLSDSALQWARQFDWTAQVDRLAAIMRDRIEMSAAGSLVAGKPAD